MASPALPTLATNRYVPPGTYIAQIIVPSPSTPGDVRLPVYVGVGSRLAVAKDLQIRRSYVFDEELSFSTSAPFQASLDFNALNDKSIAQLVKDGTAVAPSQWFFVKNTLTDLYDKIQINEEVFDPAGEYTLSYQSVDRSVLDRLPVADLREIISVGDIPSHSEYREFTHYFVNYDVTPPEEFDTNTNKTSAVEAPVADPGNGVTGVINQASSSAFNHDYTRFYRLVCTDIASGPPRVATFSLESYPISAGNVNGAPYPLTAAMTKTQISAVEVVATSTCEVPIEYGIVLEFDFTTGNFTVGDIWTFNGLGPALFELDARMDNTNQFYSMSAIAPNVNNIGFGTFVEGATNNPTNTYNAKYQMTCIASTDTSVKGTYAYVHGAGGVTFTNKVGGVAGNSNFVAFVEPTIPNAPLTVTLSGQIMTISLATNGAAVVTSTMAQVVTAVNTTAGMPFTAVTTGTASTVARNILTDMGTVTNGSPVVTGGTVFNTEVVPGSVLRFGTDTETYTVLSSLAATITLTANYTGTSGTKAITLIRSPASGGVNGSFAGTFAWAEHGDLVGTSGTFTYSFSQAAPAVVSATLSHGVVVSPEFDNGPFVAEKTLTGTVTATNGSAVLAGAGTLFTTELTIGSKIRISSQPTTIYTVLEITSNTSLTMTSSFSGITTSDLLVHTVGDIFTFTESAPRQYYKHKDNRSVVLNTTAANNAGGAGTGHVEGTFTSNTPEGSFGNFSADVNSLSPSDDDYEDGHFTLPGNILLAARNMHKGPTTSAGGNRHVVSNKYTYTATIQDTLEWSLQEKKTETFQVSDIQTDVNGTITGTSFTKYITLSNIPDTITSVVDTVTSLDVTYTLIMEGSENTFYIALASTPVNPIEVSYVYKSAEPEPGQFYYFSAKCLRPEDLYNKPILVNSIEDGRTLLAPMEPTNHLAIMTEIVMGDIKAPGMYIVQVKDADDDGIYTNVDFKAAIDASEGPKAITDLIVLSHFSSLQDQLNSLNKMADPFRRRFRMGWFGAPIGTPIGDSDTPDSIVFLSKVTLQVPSNSPAHGTRVLCGHVKATRDILLENGVTTEVTLDGSFIAGALAATVDAFSDYGQTILRKAVVGFKTIETYGDIETPDNIALGSASVIYITDRGAGNFRIEEDLTVDTFAPDFNLINNMTQKMEVTRFIEKETDSKLIGIVVPSAQAGIGLVKGFVVSALNSLVGNGKVGRYQTNGVERPIDPTQDVVVIPDTADPTKYHFYYSYYLRNSIKRLFGLYTVNSNDFTAGLVGT